MKKLKLLLIAVMVIAAGVPQALARLTASEAFVNAPSVVFPLLERNTRLDMIDYFNSGSATPSNNSMQGSSRVTAMSDGEMKIAMTDASDYQIVILPAGADSVIAVIQTVATPAHDSHLTIYTTGWEKLGDAFTPPSMDDWMTDAGRKNKDMVATMVPFVLARYELDPATDVLTVTNNLSEFLSPDVYQLVDSYLRGSLSYRWDGKRMVPAK